MTLTTIQELETKISQMELACAKSRSDWIKRNIRSDISEFKRRLKELRSKQETR